MTLCDGKTTILQNQVTDSNSHNIEESEECTETIKEEIKQEIDSEDEFNNPSVILKTEQKLEETALTSSVHFVDCGDTIRQEIKEESETEDDINPFNDQFLVKTEQCEYDVRSIETCIDSELE